MAFGKKYYSSYKSNNNLDYYLEIWVNGWVKPEVEMTMGEGGPVIEYETDQEDRFSPILSSSCKIPFLVQDNDERLFINNLRTLYQEREIYIHIYRATSSTYQSVAPLWSGFCVMDIGKGVDQAFPYVQELKFVDGLSLLKDIDFVDLDVTGGTPPFNERVQGNYATENMYYGPATYIFWFREILKKTGASLSGANGQGVTQDYGFTTCINWYNGDMDNTGQSEDPLEKTKCQVSMFHRKDDQSVYFPENCYTVLKELLRHWGARITYWKHQFWIVQIPEYITGESGTIDNPQNNFSRLYSDTGAFLGSQDHLGSTYWTRYFQEISNEKISKLTGTTYDYLPIIKQVNAEFLSFESENYYGGFPFGSNALNQEVFQGTINSPSTSDFLWLSIPLDWTWDCPNFPSGHTNGWWSSIKFNFYASDGTTTYYLQFDSTSQTLPYYWIDSSNWTPLGPRSPRYTISSKSLSVTAHVGFEQSIPFKDENGSSITMTGAWSFFLDLEGVGTTSGYGNSGSNPGCFYLNFSGYGSPQRMRNPNVGIVLQTNSGPLNSGTVSWSNSLEDPAGQINISTISNPAGFNAGTITDDIRFATTSPFLGLLQTLTNGQSSSYGETFNTINDTSAQTKANSEQFNFGQLLWGDSIEFARSSLQVDDGTDYVNTNPSGLWGVGTLTGTKTFTQLLIDEFLYGQTKIVITPTMRLAVGVANKNQTEGTATRPRYVNPIGKLRETRATADPEYIFRRGKFYTLLDEWDYEGYQIIRNVVSTSNQNNNIGNLGGNQSNAPNNSAMLINPVSQALAQNSPIAYLSATIPSTGSNVAVNGNFNVATGWTLGTGWSIDTTAKKANFTATGSTSDLVQSVLTQELTYQVNFKVVVTAGTLLVKAGTTGTTETITSSGDYSIYLTCEGSSDIKFQAGTTFTGSITYITLRDQKSLSSVPINAIGTAVFKTGDTFNLINSNDDQPLALTVTSNQGSTDTSISVSSTPLYADIDAGSYLLINQEDLSAQYQNKTKGTVGGFDITATSIDSGSVAISSYIDDDTFGTASATSLATSESIKAYVDTQVGTADTLQEVTDLGNTTTNNIMIGSSSSPEAQLDVESEILISGTDPILRMERGDGFNSDVIKVESSTDNIIIGDTSLDEMIFEVDNGEAVRITRDKKVGIGTTSPSLKLDVIGNYDATPVKFLRHATYGNIIRLGRNGVSETAHIGYPADATLNFSTGGSERMRLTSGGNLGINTDSPTEKLHVVGDALITGDSHADTFKPAVSGNPIKFKNFDSSTEFARITDDGYLGLGVTSPNAIMQISGTSPSGRALHITDNKTSKSNGTYTLQVDSSAHTSNMSAAGAFNVEVNSGNAFTIAGNGSSTFGYNVTVGGTFTPQGELHIVGQSGSQARIYVSDVDVGVGATDSLLITKSGSTSYIYNRDSNSSLYLGANDVSNVLVITNNSNVLIGTTTDDGSNKLQVNGNVKATRIISDILRDTNENGHLVTTVTNASNTVTTVGNTATANTLTLGVKSGGVVNIPNGSLTGTTATFSGGVVVSGTLNASGSYFNVGGGYGAVGLSVDSNGNLQTNGNVTIDGSLTGTTATFSGQVTIPATPVASTDAASKSYVDTQVGSADTLAEVLANGNTSGANDIIMNNNQAYKGTHTNGATYGLLTLTSGNQIKLGGYEYTTASVIIGGGDNARFNIGSTEKMRLDNSGRLLLNATSTSFNDYLYVNGDAYSAGGFRVGTSSTYVGKMYNNAGKLTIESDGDRDIQFQSGNNASIMYIDTSTQKIGIGVTSPSQKLHVNGSGYFNGNLIIENNNELRWKDSGGTERTILELTNTNDLYFGGSFAGSLIFIGGGSYTERARISDNGNLLVGGTTENAKLTVRADSGYAFRTENASGKTFRIDATNGYIEMPGNVSVGGSPGAIYKLDVVGKQRVQSVLELEDVLTLNAISTPSDPANNKSSIYMDSADGAIKVKINVGGTVVTRTIASFE